MSSPNVRVVVLGLRRLQRELERFFRERGLTERDLRRLERDLHQHLQNQKRKGKTP